MRLPSRLVPLGGLVLALGLVASSCSMLRDTQPFTQTIAYDDQQGSGPVTIEPQQLEGDAAFGLIQVVNDATEEHGFSIDELAVFEKIPAGQSKTITVQEARDGRTYLFYCQIHDKDAESAKEFRGELVIRYKAEEER